MTDIHEVRQRVIAEWNAIVDGRVDSDARTVLWRWDDRHLINLRWLIPQIVDATLARVVEARQAVNSALPGPTMRH